VAWTASTRGDCAPERELRKRRDGSGMGADLAAAPGGWAWRATADDLPAAGVRCLLSGGCPCPIEGLLSLAPRVLPTTSASPPTKSEGVIGRPGRLIQDHLAPPRCAAGSSSHLYSLWMTR
jgi:hypothetical protein